MKKNRIINPIAYQRSGPCVTITMNTPGCQSNNSQLETELNRLTDQAKFLVLEKYHSTPLNPILEKLNALPGSVSFADHLKSITVYLSESATEILSSMWAVPHNRVQVADRFDIRPLVAISNNTQEYNILLLSHKKVKLLNAVNDVVHHELKQGIFPITKGLNYLAPHFKSADSTQEKNLRDFFSDIDSDLIRLYNASGVHYIVAAADDNYERFSEVIRFASMYWGHIPLSNDLTNKNLAAEAWALIENLQKQQRLAQVKLMQDLISSGEALTTHDQIRKAAQQGRGDLLIVNDQAKLPDQEEDIVCEAVWDVISNHGQVTLAEQDEAGSIQTMALKLKY